MCNYIWKSCPPVCGSCQAPCQWSLSQQCSDHGRSCWQRPPCHWSAAQGETSDDRSHFAPRLIGRSKSTTDNIAARNYVGQTKIVWGLPITVGSKSTKTALGTCFPAPVSVKNVLEESSPAPNVFVFGNIPSCWIPCSRQYSSQQALPIWTPVWPMWIEIHSRCRRQWGSLTLVTVFLSHKPFQEPRWNKSSGKMDINLAMMN